MLSVLMQAAAAIKHHAINLSDCDLRNDPRFARQGVVIPLHKAGEYGAETGEVVVVYSGQKPRQLMFIPLETNEEVTA